MLVHELLQEGLSDVLYHVTTLNGAYNILTSGVFKMSIATDVKSEIQLQEKGKIFYLSTGRTKINDYSRQMGVNSAVFVLDGRRIGQRYSGKAVDYWRDTPSSFRHRETEDRIFSNKNTMPVGYATEVHVYTTEFYISQYNRQLRDMYILAHKNGIKFYFYTDERDWLLQNKDKAVKLTQFKELLKNAREINPTRESTHALEELIKKNSTESLSRRAKTLAYNLVYGDDRKRIISDLINSRTPSSSDYESTVRINEYMRTIGVSTYNELVDVLRMKWRDIKNKESGRK